MDFYNLDYYVLGELVSCVFSFIICVNIVTNFSVKELRQRLFFYGGIGTFVTSLFNILAVFCITYYRSIPCALGTTASTMFFLFLMLTPMVLSDYSISVSYGFNAKRFKLWGCINSIIYFIYVLVILLNIKTGWVFRYDSEAGYIRGPLKNITYLLTAVYTIITLTTVAMNKKAMATRLYLTFLAYPVVAVLIMVFQFFFPKVILTGTSSCAALFLAYISIQSDLLEFDIATGLMTERKLRKHVERNHKENYFYMIYIENMPFIQNNMDAGDFTNMLLKIGNFFGTKFQRRSYHPGTSRFAALHENLDEIKTYSEQIINFINSPEIIKELNIPVQFECYPVVVKLTEEYQNYGTVMEIANNMIKKAMVNGSKEVVVSDESVLLELERKRLIFKILERELRTDSKQFQVWFQPIYSIEEKRFTYMEALSRLRETELGDISPQEFIEVAENRGLIEKLGFVAFEKVCQFIAANRDVVQAVSINFSVYQMTNPHVVQNVLSTVAKFGLNPSNIIMEITESIFIDNYALVMKNMKELSLAGVKFYLDDFGTGYSNLSNVVRLPFSTIKFDRSLVLMMEENEKNQRLFTNLVETFKDASLKILVEGVETQAQNDLVQKAGTDYIQGFLYSRPLPESECLELLKKK